MYSCKMADHFPRQRLGFVEGPRQTRCCFSYGKWLQHPTANTHTHTQVLMEIADIQPGQHRQPTHVLGVDSSRILFSHCFFQKPIAISRGIFGGFLERRIPGKTPSIASTANRTSTVVFKGNCRHPTASQPQEVPSTTRLQ